MINRMTKWADRYEKINETQFGFRKGKGTTDCLFILHGLIELLLEKGINLYVCFIDYQKAYDYLDRAALWSKLLKAGMSSKSIRLFRNMYAKMRLGIKGDDRSFKSDLGLLQGETCSPLFFSLYVNDIETSLTGNLTGVTLRGIILKILKFADDVMCLVSETREGLQQGLDDLARYCSKWGTIVNMIKTKILVFHYYILDTQSTHVAHFQSLHITYTVVPPLVIFRAYATSLSLCEMRGNSSEIWSLLFLMLYLICLNMARNKS